MQTAVEKLISQIKGYPSDCEIFQDALEMEKQQHHKTWLDSTSQFDNSAQMTYKKDFKQYFTETYLSKESDKIKQDEKGYQNECICDRECRGFVNVKCKKLKQETTSSQTEISDEVDRIMDLAEKSRNALNDVAHLCSGEVEEHIFDMGFYSGFNLARETYGSKGSGMSEKPTTQTERMYSEKDLKQFAWECVANFLSNDENKVEGKLVDIIIDRNDYQFKKFKKK